MILHRRKFLTGLGVLMAAPAIVSASNIMPVKMLPVALEQFDPVYFRAAGFDGDVFVGKQRFENVDQAIIANHRASREKPAPSPWELAEDARMFGDLRSDIMQAWVSA